MKNRIFTLLAAPGILVLCLVACNQEEEEEFKFEDVIAFTREGKIHIMNPDGSNVTLLGNGGTSPTDNGDGYYYVHHMAWSPNGRMIAYSTQDGSGIYTMSMDGFEVKKVVAIASAAEPTWSSDGRSLAFTQYNFPSYCIKEISTCFNICRIFIGSLNGPDITSTNLEVDTLSWWPVYDMLPRQAFDMHPDWSPDNKKIIFSSDRATILDIEGVHDIYTMNRDGSEVSRLTDSDVQKFHPVWSPDGKKIAFEGRGNGNNSSSIYVMNADGSGLFQVTHNLSPGGHYPTWSPDGSRLAFASDHDGNREIYVIKIDGTGLRRITNDPRADQFPAWSPGRLKMTD